MGVGGSPCGNPQVSRLVTGQPGGVGLAVGERGVGRIVVAEVAVADVGSRLVVARDGAGVGDDVLLSQHAQGQQGDEVQGLSLGKFNLQKSVVKEVSAEDLKKQRQCKEKQENVAPWDPS